MTESNSGADQKSGGRGDGKRRRRRGRRRGKGSGEGQSSDQSGGQQQAGGRSSGGQQTRGGGNRGNGSAKQGQGGGQQKSSRSRRRGSSSGSNRNSGRGDNKRTDGNKKGRGKETSDDTRLTVTLPSAPRVNRTKRPPKNRRMEHTEQRYAMLMYDSFAQAKADLEQIKTQAANVDQLNLVIKAEGDMDDPELYVADNMKVFAGAAWALIHERRKEDGWYDEPR